MDQNYFYDYLLKVLSITKIGLVFSKDEYALQNYAEIQKLTENMLENFEKVNFDRPNYFERDVYPTPNISCRAIIFNKERNKVFLVQEKKDGKYSLPGGWCDLYDSPTEAIVRECKEEGGLDVEVKKIVAILNRTPFKSSTSTPEYALFFECEIRSDNGDHDHEILSRGFYDVNNLPANSCKMTEGERNKTIKAALEGKILLD